MFFLQGFYWLVGKRSSQDVEGREDYFLASKSVSLFPLMMTFLATQVGGGVILGAADEAYRFGWSVFLYPLGGALGMMVLGAGFGRKLAEFKVSTVAEIFEVVYRSKRLKQVASVLSVISLFMILVAQIIASHKFLVSIGLVSAPLFVLFWAIVIFYTAQGGLKAVIATDMVQAAFFSVVFLVCFFFVGASNLEVFQTSISFENVSHKLTGWLLMPLFFMLIEQDMGQRCFAAGSPKIVSRATFLAGLSMIVVCIVPIFFGVLAKEANLVIPEGASVLMTSIEWSTGPVISAIVGCAILAAVISTVTSLINAISSNVFSDFGLNTNLSLVRLITSGISFGAIGFAFYFDSIVDVLIQSYELSVSCLFVPIIWGLFKKEGNFISALLAISFGALAFVSFRVIEIPLREVVSVLISLSGFVLGEVIERLRVRAAIKIDEV